MDGWSTPSSRRSGSCPRCGQRCRRRHKATTLSTATAALLLSILRRSIRRAPAQDLIRRNVALLAEMPEAKPAVYPRPSRSTRRGPSSTFHVKPIHAYIATALLRGLERRSCALTSRHLDLEGDPPTITSGAAQAEPLLVTRRDLELAAPKPIRRHADRGVPEDDLPALLLPGGGSLQERCCERLRTSGRIRHRAGSAP